MSENVTQNQDGGRPFEERVIALLNDLRDRVISLEAKSYDTKPIWERALAEIIQIRSDFNELRADFNELRGDFNELHSKFNELHDGFNELRSDFDGLRSEVDGLKIIVERGFRSVERKLDVFNQDLLDLRDSYRRLEDNFQTQR